MEKRIKNLNIKNFKSIRDISLDCSQINVFIGKPNVGKSNILEALALYRTQYGDAYLKDFIRFETIDNLFYFKDIDTPISIESELGEVSFEYNSKEEKYLLFVNRPEKKQLPEEPPNSKSIIQYFAKFENAGFKELSSWNHEDAKTNVRKYSFDKSKSVKNFKNQDSFLTPPYGVNLITILEKNRNLQAEVSSFFKEYDLYFALNRFDKTIDIERKQDFFVDKIPYSLTADTLQRIIFHYAAIESNKDSILLFEEPENHSFPPYIRSLAEKIIESKENQFFIATHSPYLFNTLLSDSKEGELSVFITTFDNHETKVKKLSEKDLSEISDYGIDVFFNLTHFENE